MTADYSQVRAERKIIAFHDAEKLSNFYRGAPARH
jgi:hypothetical protein